VEKAFSPALEAMAGSLGKLVPDVRSLAAEYAGRNLQALQSASSLDDIEILLTSLENGQPDLHDSPLREQLTRRAFDLFEVAALGDHQGRPHEEIEHATENQ
jgi:hypothetical protein